MSNALDLNNKGPRRQGLNRQGFKNNQRLLEHGLHIEKSSRPKSPEVDAPPQSSSDEASTVREINGEDLSSKDVTIIGDTETKEEASTLRNLGKRDDLRSSRKDKRPELSVEASTIIPTTFGPSKGSATTDGYRGSQQRKWECTDESEEAFGMGSASQSKRRKTAQYSGSSQRSAGKSTQENIHHLPAARDTKRKVNKRGPSATTVDGNGFKTLDTGNATALIDEQQSEPKGPKFKNPPNKRRLPRSQRASQRLAGSGQGSSECSPKNIYKKPPNLCSKDTTLPTENVGPEYRSLQRPVLNRKGMQDAVDTSTDILGMPDVQYKPPLSSVELSSAPSVSHDADPRLSSPLSIPPQDSGCSDANEQVEPVIPAADSSFPLNSFLCPLCKQPIEKAFWEENLQIDQRPTLRQQLDFCTVHKKKTAYAEWERLGYPTIDWSDLSSRLTQFHPRLEDILHRRRLSFYRNVFEDLVKSRKDRPMKQDLMTEGEVEDTSPGYYGSRGAKIM